MSENGTVFPFNPPLRGDFDHGARMSRGKVSENTVDPRQNHLGMVQFGPCTPV